MSVRASLDLLRTWAASGGTLEGTPPAADDDRRLTAPAPHYGGPIRWALPPSYRAFLAEHSRLLIKWGEDCGYHEFIVLAPDEITEVSDIAYLPEGVSRGPGKVLSTNHLVPFASGGDSECQFCFDITAPDPAGEYPVYYNHQDEARARYLDGGAWEDPTNERPDFENFAVWLAWVASELTAGREPASSEPSAFLKMRRR